MAESAVRVPGGTQRSEPARGMSEWFTRLSECQVALGSFCTRQYGCWRSEIFSMKRSKRRRCHLDTVLACALEEQLSYVDTAALPGAMPTTVVGRL